MVLVENIEDAVYVPVTYTEVAMLHEELQTEVVPQEICQYPMKYGKGVLVGDL